MQDKTLWCFVKQRVCTGGNCRDGCCDRFGLKSPPETQIKDTTKAQTVEPETPPSGKATNPINLTDEADETPHHFQKVIAILRKYMAVLSMTTTAPTSKMAYRTTQSGRATIDVR
jgi:hypothetical protein